MPRALVEKQIRQFLDKLKLPYEIPDSEVSEFVNILEGRTGKVLLPKPNETTAIAFLTPKTAALAFDRIWRLPTLIESIPEEVGYYGATPLEVLPQIDYLLEASIKESGIAEIEENKVSLSPIELTKALENFYRELAKVHSEKLGVNPTIVYDSLGAQAKDFHPGPREVLMLALNRLAIADEESLSWDQVIEFRKDQEAKLKYRRIVRWIDEEMKAASSDEIVDKLAARLEDYHWSMRKHGLKALNGSITALLEPKFMGTLSASLAGASLAAGGVAGLLTAGVVAVGKVTAEFTRAKIDGEEERRNANQEISYVHELSKHLRSSK